MKYLLILSFLILSACSSTPEISSKSELTDIIKLIEKAKRRYPEGVRGTFQISIKASGNHGGVIFLNSDVDYRDPKNITVVLEPSTIESFSKIYNASPDSYFINKTIEVKGKVERIKIYRYTKARRTGEYYFQTHIKVTSIDQISVLS